MENRPVGGLQMLMEAQAFADRRHFRNLTILSLCLALWSAGLSADTKGLVVASRGTVLVESRELKSRELKQGDEVTIGDAITTGPKSFAVIQFLDGAKVTIKPDSELVIEEYVYNGNSEDKATLSLVSGGLRAITGAMAKSNPENYKLKTPVALMGVRGTEFAIQLLP